MDPFARVLRGLHKLDTRFLVIGVWGANYYARGGTVVFETRDRDVFFPPDAANLVKGWRACEAAGLSLWMGDEPLDSPRDAWLAERIVERRTSVRATDQRGLDVDLTLVMAGFDFETVWAERRLFVVEGAVVAQPEVQRAPLGQPPPPRNRTAPGAPPAPPVARSRRRARPRSAADAAPARTQGFCWRVEHLANLKAAVAVFTAWDNFCRVHQPCAGRPPWRPGYGSYLDGAGNC